MDRTQILHVSILGNMPLDRQDNVFVFNSFHLVMSYHIPYTSANPLSSYSTDNECLKPTKMNILLYVLS